MHPFLLSLSLIATAIGVFAIGFGIPNRDFSLGDLLIIVGTVAIVGGMIMFGLAAAVRQLQRIADGMTPRAAPKLLGRGRSKDPSESSVAVAGAGRASGERISRPALSAAALGG